MQQRFVFIYIIKYYNNIILCIIILLFDIICNRKTTIEYILGTVTVDLTKSIHDQNP